MRTYRVVTTGALREGTSPELALQALVAAFAVDVERLRPLVSGRSISVKRGVDERTARVFQESLDRAGVLCRIEAEPEVARESAPTPAPAERRTCPSCGYRAATPDDPLLTAHDGRGECPRCGIIPAKARPSSRAAAQVAPAPAQEATAAQPSPPDAGKEESTEAGEYPTPSLHERLLAHVITNCYVVIPVFICRVVAVLLVTSAYGDELFTVVNLGFYSYTKLNERAADAMSGIPALVAFAFFFHEYVYLPSSHGATRGELMRGIVIATNSGDDARGLALFGRRLAGVLISGLLVVPAFVPFLHRSRRTLADLISRSRPVRVAAPSGAGWRIFALALVVGAISEGLSAWRIHAFLPETAAAKAARVQKESVRSEAANRSAERALSGMANETGMKEDVEKMLELYHRDHGRYTEDPELLVSEYGRKVVGYGEPFVRAAAIQGRITIELGEGRPKVSIRDDGPRHGKHLRRGSGAASASDDGSPPASAP